LNPGVAGLALPHALPRSGQLPGLVGQCQPGFFLSNNSTWPDAAKAMDRVATIRIASPSESDSDSNTAEPPAHMVLPFAGHVFSFAQLQVVIEELTGIAIKASSLPWPIFKLLGLA